MNELVMKALRFKTWNRSQDWLPNLQAHRGFCLDGARENTLASLAQAKAKKFEMSEIDVRLSYDEIPVLCHDQRLNRLVGVNKVFSKMTVAELAKYDFPTLEEVLKSKDRPRKINIEIKNDDRRDLKLERKIIEVIKSSKKSKDILVSSFNPFSLIPFIEGLPDVPRALLIGDNPFAKFGYFRIIGSLVAQPHMINWPHQLLNQTLVEFLKDNNVPVAVWTVNDYRQAQELYSWGVDCIISDRIEPDLLTTTLA